MADAIDVHDLTEDELKQVQCMIDTLREQKKKSLNNSNKETIKFGQWPLGIKGTLSRKELYEDR